MKGYTKFCINYLNRTITMIKILITDTPLLSAYPLGSKMCRANVYNLH